jgi:uncharacterized protein YbaP (TraB family)
MQKNRLMFKLYCVLILLFTGQLANAQEKKASLLWEISGNGLQQPSFLFGTFHILCKEDFPLSEILKYRIRSAKQFYSELKMDDPSLQMKLMSAMMLNGKTLETLMGREDYKMVSDSFQHILGMPLAPFNSFKPFMPMSLLAIRSINCKEQVQPESMFVELAKQAHIPLMGLETVEDQVNAIDKEPLDSQVNSLKQIALHFDSVKNVMAQMVAVYKLRDVDSIYAFMKQAGTNDSFESNMLVERNRKWVPVIQNAMQANPIFIAVGAGHLGGEEGLISLLRKRGFRLIPVKY